MRQRPEGRGHQPRTTWSHQKLEAAGRVPPRASEGVWHVPAPRWQASGLQTGGEWMNVVLSHWARGNLWLRRLKGTITCTDVMGMRVWGQRGCPELAAQWPPTATRSSLEEGREAAQWEEARHVQYKFPSDKQVPGCFFLHFTLRIINSKYKEW